MHYTALVATFGLALGWSPAGPSATLAARTEPQTQTQQQTPPPVPRPFPGQATPPATTTKPAPPSGGVTAAPPVSSAPLGASTSPSVPAASAQPPASQPAAGPTEAELGVRFYPGAEYLESFDAGRGQRLYLFGTNVSYAVVVQFYKDALRNGGKELFRAPSIQQFDLGKFQEQTMAFQPSVVVKDYASGGAAGYLHVDGDKGTRFKTVIQIVPGPIVR